MILGFEMRKFVNYSVFVALICVTVISCAKTEIYRNPEAPVEKRVEDLLSRMTLEEKIYQVTQWTCGINTNENNVGDEMKEVSPMTGSLLYRSTSPVFYNMVQRKAVEESRLGIPLICGFDVIHGYRTIFPIPLAQACSWNPGIVGEACEVSASEAKSSGVFWTFSPMVDVARDSRWGRVSEGYGEDPYLNGIMGAAAVRGYQGESLDGENSIAACLKHYVGYAYSQGGRDYQYTEISRQSLWDTALPPFEEGVKAGAATLMSSFNDISGVPGTANHYTLTEVLRDKWGFDGFVVSDWDAVRQLQTQGVAEDRAEACLKAISAGVDMDMVDDVYLENIDSLVTTGILDENILDEAVRRILRVKFRLGLFENPYIEELSEQERFLLPEYRTVARNLASETFVLLENNDALLPLSSENGRIAVMGPLADNTVDILGSWSAFGSGEDAVSILDGLKNVYGTDVKYVAGCPFDGNDRSGFAAAKRIARASDAVILCMGEKASWSGENASRASLALPCIQEDFIREIAACGKPVIVLVSSGRAVELSRIAEWADALMLIWQPGTEGGNAVADIISGKVNPSGKLAITFPYNAEQQPSYYNQRQSARPFMGHYQDIPKEPVYEFGYGLSYTDFEYGDIRLSSPVVTENGTLVAEIDVTNTGKTDGQETLLWFVRDHSASISRPVKELKHFEKHFIPAGETYTFRFEIEPCRDLSYPDSDGNRILEKGKFSLIAGDSETGFELR